MGIESFQITALANDVHIVRKNGCWSLAGASSLPYNILEIMGQIRSNMNICKNPFKHCLRENPFT